MISGWVILDKPIGLSSTQVGTIVRRLIDPIKPSRVKLGHVGTLDPLASGVLPLAIGEATKLIPYFKTDTKTYEFEIAWGEKKDTGDLEGQTVALSDKRPTHPEILSILPGFLGSIEQTPPVYSAIKIQGKRAYDYARSGVDVEMPKRIVSIFSLDLLETPDADHARFQVVCGKGTYVRSLAQDIAEKLGTFGYVSQLKRTQDGKFKLPDAIPLEKIQEMAHNKTIEQCIWPIGAVLDDIPAVSVSNTDREKIRQGMKIPLDDHDDDQVISILYEGRVLAIGSVQSGYFHPKRVLHI
ncbi:MAG: tRNA pseudouridine(55) synthase TruB [Alphaproteobacteria bacterium]|nr:tRNA pseudouridine(55) synthase TruB [Alphaproteobacteria bacterium]